MQGFLKALLGLVMGMHLLVVQLLMPPMHGFDCLADLPEQYRDCKTIEHADMDISEFVFEHLLNLGSLSDTHPAGDSQKAHASTLGGGAVAVAFGYVYGAVVQPLIILPRLGFRLLKVMIPHRAASLTATYASGTFRPPIK